MSTNLFLNTCYSLLKSTIRLDDVIKKAKEFRYDSLAITDNTLYGAFKFYLKCKDNGIKPIIGLKVTISEVEFLLYAKNNEGYKNLRKISSTIEVKGNISLDIFEKYSSGIILVSLGSYLLENVEKYKIFEFYLGVQLDELDYEINFAPKIVEIGRKHNVDIVALSLVKYLFKADYIYYKAIRCINSGTKLDKEDLSLGEHYLRTPEENKGLFKEYVNAYNNAEILADKCNVEIDYGSYQLPKYPLEKHTSKEYLLALCKKGLEKRLVRKKLDSKKYIDRLLHELEIIDQMGFNDYFLIVWDLVAYAKKNSIFVGPGRGSAAGSLVAYVLGITNTDPIEYDLLFERFLNPSRSSMPDIDLDFPDDKRDEMILYTKDKYSHDNVTLIVTFGTFAGRSAIRDVAKILDINSDPLDEVLKYILVNASNLKKLMLKEDLARLSSSIDEINMLLEYASEIEGLPRHTSTHAAGVIVTEKNILEYTAVQKGMLDLYQTQFEAKDLEKLGLLKMDFLGLRNLTILDNTVRLIKEHLNIDINLYDLEFDDKVVFKLIGNADTYGVFQLESQGMKSLLKRLQVSEFEDVIAAIALHRPGPMENIPEYVARKTGKRKIQYIHNDIQEILENNYGIVIVKQELFSFSSNKEKHPFLFAKYPDMELERTSLSEITSNNKTTILVFFMSKNTKANTLQEDMDKVGDVVDFFSDGDSRYGHSTPTTQKILKNIENIYFIFFSCLTK